MRPVWHKYCRLEIDILVDLAGHTAGNRLALFGTKSAPIQATYLGYYGTTGLTSNGLLADRFDAAPTSRMMD